MFQRGDFLSNHDVRGFVKWLREEAVATLKVTLKIPQSPKVPGGVDGSFVGLPEVVAAYTWRSTCRVNGTKVEARDWQSTRALLAALGSGLKSAIKRVDGDGALAVCMEILQWGGNRNPRIGRSRSSKISTGTVG